MAVRSMGARRKRHFPVLSRVAEDIRPSRDDNVSGIPGSEEGQGALAVPCRNGKKLRDCHFDQVKDLIEKISRKDAERSFAVLRAAGESAVEMTEATPAIPPIPEESNP